MTPEQYASFAGILLGCLIVTIIPYSRKKYIEKSIEQFNIEYAVTMLIAMVISVVASFGIFLANPEATSDPFVAFGSGLILGVFDNFWVNEAKKFIYADE